MKVSCYSYISYISKYKFLKISLNVAMHGGKNHFKQAQSRNGRMDIPT